MTSEHNLRDLARNAVRQEVMRQAWRLFAAHGFDATTIDQIADAAGMSRRTFFRYFTGKEELIVEQLVEAGERVADALAALPADEPVWPALRDAFAIVVEAAEAHPEQSRALRIMLRDEATVRGSLQEWRRRWTELLSPLVVRRLPAAPGADPGLRAEALAGSALACLDAAQSAWAEQPEASLARLVDDAMGAVAPLDR